MEEKKQTVIESDGVTAIVVNVGYTTKKEFILVLRALTDYYNNHKEDLS